MRAPFFVSLMSEHHQSDWAADGWLSIETTIGAEGNMGGIVLKDEEYHDVCRVTLEQSDSPPYILSVEIYGAFMRVIFASDSASALQKYQAVKTALAEFVDGYDESVSFERWCDDFVRRF